MKTTKFRTSMFLGAMMALSVALPQMAGAQEVVAARTTVITACGKLFSIDSNAANLTPEQRAQIVQKNLDNALIAAKHHTPDAVRVGMMNRNPIVTLDGFYIVTADANSAERNGMTQLQLAQKWADSIRFCMADAEAMKNYIAMLTGRYPNRTASTVNAGRSTDVAVLPWGMNLPVRLTAPLNTDNMRFGDTVTAELTTDVPLEPKFNAYLPAGTVALGNLVDAKPFNPNNFAGKRAAMVDFYALQTPDGSQIPINGHILGGANTFRYVTVNPIKSACCAELPKAQISGSTISMGNTTVTTQSMTVKHPFAQAGTITGAWRSNPIDFQAQESFHRLMLTRDTGMIIPAGVPLTLQLNSSSSIAVNSAVPASGTQVSAIGVGSM